MLRFTSLGLLAGSSLLLSMQPPSQLEVVVERKSEATGCIMGYLLVDDEVVAYTLELPWLYNINDLSAIPTGSYSGFIRTDGKLGWRVELLNVAGRKNVQMHIGNYTRQTKGCILIGTGARLEGCAVENSADALGRVRERLEAAIFKGDINSSPEIEFIVR